MARTRGIWYRKQTGWYYTTINGEKVKLAQTEEAAEVEFHRVMAEQLSTVEMPGGTAAANRVAFAVVANAFLDRSKQTNAHDTYLWHRNFLKSFAKHSGKVRYCDLTPYHFNRWVATRKSWNDGGKRGAVTVVKACMNWWANEHNIPTHPLARLKGPPGRAREGILTDQEQQKVFDAIKPTDPFREFVFALQQSGCRPSEIRRVCPEHFDVEQGIWVMPGKTTRKTGQHRIVFLTPALVELCQRLVKGRKEGEPIFRNKFGGPWTRKAVDYRFVRLAKRVKLRFATYTLRRSFVTLGLEKGVPIAQMATLAGHSDTKMVMRHYAKLKDRVQHMRSMAAKVTEGAAGANQ